jgi:hypothetical protein
MTIICKPFSSPNPHNHVYSTNVILSEEELQRVDMAIETLLVFREAAKSNATYRCNTYIPANTPEINLIKAIVNGGTDETEYRVE